MYYFFIFSFHMFSKQLINNFRYLHSIQSNGSIFSIFDYNSDGFKVNEVHYNNFFLTDNIFLKLNNIYFIFFNEKLSYYSKLHDKYLIHFKGKFIIDSLYNYSIKNKKIFFNKKINLKKNKVTYNHFENTFFKDKLFSLSSEIHVYNNLKILKILSIFTKKIFFNIFFNI